MSQPGVPLSKWGKVGVVGTNAGEGNNNQKPLQRVGLGGRARHCFNIGVFQSVIRVNQMGVARWMALAGKDGFGLDTISIVGSLLVVPAVTLFLTVMWTTNCLE